MNNDQRDSIAQAYGVSPEMVEQVAKAVCPTAHHPVYTAIGVELDSIGVSLKMKRLIWEADAPYRERLIAKARTTNITVVDTGDLLRNHFEALASDSYGFKRSRKGTYVNGSVARDWKWFKLGVSVGVKP